MAGLGDYGKYKLLNAALGQDSFLGVPYLGFSTTTVSNTSIGTEVTGGGYARRAISADMVAAILGDTTITNGATMTFTNMPACTVTDAFITDGNTGSDIIWYTTLSVAVSLDAGENFDVNPGDLICTL